MVSPARQEAFKILMRVEDGAYASTLLLNTDGKPEDRRLTQEIVLGVLRNYRLLDHYLEIISGRDLQRFDPEVTYALRIGAYQLLYLDRIPPSAAVNESVKLVKLCRKASASGLVNAVLRKLASGRQRLFEVVVEPALRYSHPDWLYRSWVEHWGDEWAEALAAANNETPPVMFRFNPLHPEVERGRKALEGFYTGSKLLPTACRLLEDAPKDTLNALIAEGICYIQDEASQLVASLVGAMPGETVLDLCAAPGGKTAALAAYMQNSGRLIATELHLSRAKTLAATLCRMHAVADVVCCDATAPALAIDFDRILVDAPCSGTGTLRRN
ncbi:MAG: transcription antitermination factor NusB, partial [Candidatus Bathyarchaeia archaeon]